jgi:chromosome segregation ATPase
LEIQVQKLESDLSSNPTVSRYEQIGQQIITTESSLVAETEKIKPLASQVEEAQKNYDTKNKATQSKTLAKTKKTAATKEAKAALEALQSKQKDLAAAESSKSKLEKELTNLKSEKEKLGPSVENLKKNCETKKQRLEELRKESASIGSDPKIIAHTVNIQNYDSKSLQAKTEAREKVEQILKK